MKNSVAVTKGVLWSAIDRFAVVGIQVLFEILLARLLLPSDYGLIGMVVVFMAIAQVFVDSGFMNALIQKQDRTELDFSTVFYASVGISLIIYLLLFISAPAIAIFYNVPQLTGILRVLGLNVIINSIALVYRAKLSISMDFKTQAKLSIVSVILAGLTGIYLAFHGHGVWSLVYQSICLYTLNALLLGLNVKWLPLLKFSQHSFRTLFGFGSKLLAAGLIQAIYSNLYSVLIGKVFSTKELGLYAKSSQFTLYPSSMMTNMLQRVLYPYLSQYQNDNKTLFELNKQYYTIIAMLFFPLFVGLGVLAEPFVRLLLSDTWLEAVPLIRILAITFLFYPFINVNMFIFQIKGMSSRFLWIEVLTKITGVIILLITIKYGLLIMSIGLLVQHLIQLTITSYFSDKAMNCKLFSQLRVLFPMVLISTLFAIIVYSVIQFIQIPLIQLSIGILMFVILYMTYYYFFMRNLVLVFINRFIK
ncbi:MAG: lipopolysaccharide biosynthesis protein [Bacteroidales bacterium]|nr:lipopolysaccharide biosynthesis protein [Bacteroidales bacterium]